MRTSLVLAAASLVLVAAPALAADRTARADRELRDSNALNTLPLVVAPSPVVVGQPDIIHTSSQGMIHSSASVSTNSGGNQGGNVVTGDQSQTTTVVNINNGGSTVTTGTPAPTPAPTPSCSGRDCPRTR